jgi:hypothetical protein
MISGRSLLLNQVTKLVIKLTVIIIVGYHCIKFIQNFIKYPSLTAKSYMHEIIGDHQYGF